MARRLLVIFSLLLALAVNGVNADETLPPASVDLKSTPLKVTVYADVPLPRLTPKRIVWAMKTGYLVIGSEAYPVRVQEATKGHIVLTTISRDKAVLRSGTTFSATISMGRLN